MAVQEVFIEAGMDGAPGQQVHRLMEVHEQIMNSDDPVEVARLMAKAIMIAGWRSSK